jgi:hypothetical protein
LLSLAGHPVRWRLPSELEQRIPYVLELIEETA